MVVEAVAEVMEVVEAGWAVAEVMEVVEEVTVEEVGWEVEGWVVAEWVAAEPLLAQGSRTSLLVLWVSPVLLLALLQAAAGTISFREPFFLLLVSHPIDLN